MTALQAKVFPLAGDAGDWTLDLLQAKLVLCPQLWPFSHVFWFGENGSLQTENLKTTVIITTTLKRCIHSMYVNGQILWKWSVVKYSICREYLNTENIWGIVDIKIWRREFFRAHLFLLYSSHRKDLHMLFWVCFSQFHHAMKILHLPWHLPSRWHYSQAALGTWTECRGKGAWRSHWQKAAVAWSFWDSQFRIFSCCTIPLLSWPGCDAHFIATRICLEFQTASKTAYAAKPGLDLAL